ncbi:fumarylacetoacetate hydrolase family protein [Virgisporangium ochraceum]|uniref:2-hydroxyhepta-2,4-diene-1,7-dioate isomerase n=1 Tax=Virgisporangium ochraceum TaxID=65505 RepID=A0A8J4A121_9ACTN|nr:fumarylacetoacetate hydrolase family protein [Virgisporangium ochraceum]GIJ73859.1 2-hydroxyhepta-2,4-diene-1,7-dioate isomerase [Virgisporangium ochraceum]
MKLARVGEPGAERPVAVLDDGRLVDLSSVTTDIDPAFVAAVAAGNGPALDGLPTVEAGRYGPPLNRPGKIVCIGMNYHRHAAEVGAPTPTEPVVFMKAPDTIVGPDDTVLVPRNSVKTDWEVELGVVIGRTARYLGSPEEALEHVAGYVLSHDVSEREFQLDRGGQWDKGKNCETFNPLGPWLVTADEVGDPQTLGLRLWVNGEAKQNGTTADMVFGVGEIVRYLSQFMTLYPGDLINTGTPAGVALGQPDPKPYLKAGDVVELEIDGLGRQRQTLGAA